MEGNWRRFLALTLLILLGLLCFKVKFDLQDEDLNASLKRIISEEKTLWPDIAALHGLRLPNETNDINVNQWESLIQSLKQWQDDLHKCQDVTSCLQQKEKEFESFLKDIADQKVQLRLLHASEISHNYSQKLLVMTDKDESTEEQVDNEYSLDSHNSEIVSVECLQKSSCVPEADSNTVVKIFGRLSADGQTVSGLSGSTLAEKMLDLVRKDVPLFSLEGTTSTGFQHSFLQTLMTHNIRAILEMNQGNHQTYKAINEPDPVSRYEIPQEDHTTQYDHQHILIMENDPVVKKAAEYLWQKHSANSSVYVLDENHQPKLLYGDPKALTERSRLVVLGHGARENSGEMTISGYKAKYVANIIKRTNRVGDKIQTVSIVACGSGSLDAFARDILTELDAANIKTKLHLRQAKVQVTHDGKKITQATNEAEWRHKDGNQKMVAVLNNGKLVITKTSKSKGDIVSTSRSEELTNEKRFMAFKTNRPEQPEIFIDQNVIEKFDPAASIDLMALSWAIFPPSQHRPRKVNITNVEGLNNKYRIMNHTKNKKNIDWLETEQEISDVLSRCYEIKSGEDVRNIIQHYAETGEKEVTYLMVNNLIYAVYPQSLYVYLIGKKLDNNEINNTGKIKDIEACIEEQIGNEKYPDMKKHIVDESTLRTLRELSMERCVQLFKDIFRGKQTNHLPLSTEAWCTTYFTATTISESARNYRTFVLILMALEMADSTDNNIREIGVRFFFENHPMARGASWVDPSNRGHRGTARAEGSSKLTNNNIKNRRTIEDLKRMLERVVELEVKHYKSWNKIQDPQKVLEKILGILVEYILIQKSEIGLIVKRYKSYYEHINSTQASGSLGRYNDPTTQNLMSTYEVEKLEDDLLLKSHLSKLKASVVDQVHSRLKSQYKDNLVQMHLQEGSARIEDGEFICQLVTKGVGPVEFRVKLSPESRFYNEKMSAAHEPETHSYIGNILWSVVKSSAFVLLVIVTIRTTERDSELRNRRQSRDGAANPTAGVGPKQKAKEQKMTKIISIVVNTQEGSELRFQIELFAPLSHVMNTYCEVQNETMGSFKFYYKDCAINVTDTPLQLGMEDEDIIEVYEWAIPG